MSYQPKTYRDNNGDRLVIANGGSIVVESGGTLNLLAPNGAIYFVDANSGVDTNDGLSWGSAFLTMSKAFTSIASGDTIVFRGKIREQLTTPVQVFDVTVIGAGNRPRHADSTPDGGQNAANTWTIPASGATTAPLVKVIQQGWRFQNILFAGPTDHACIQLFRDAGAGDAERDASHAEIIGCRFASGQDGIEQYGGCYNVLVQGCTFNELTGYALKNGNVGVANPGRWQILNNRFEACANLMGAWQLWGSQFNDNTIANTTSALIDTSGGSGDNTFLRNSFDIAAASFDPDGGVTGKAGDVWSNYLTDALETGLPAN
jgi:hypothetical protein